MLLDNFSVIANAPGGVVRLRELILSLAFQGRLLEQDASDETASTLIEIIEREKDQSRDRGLRLVKSNPDIAPRDKPHALPNNWEWVHFGTIAQHNAGKTLDKGRNTGQLRDYITTSNLYWGRFDLSSVRQMQMREEELDRCSARSGDLLICEGGEAGRAAVWEGPSEICFQNHIHRARFYGRIDPYYAFHFFQKLNATGEINMYRKGVGISNMSTKVLASVVFPLAPINEQKRIVTKVNELLALCDELETRNTAKNRLYPDLSMACHNALVQAPSMTGLDRIFDEMDQYSPSDLRETILSLATMGKLTEQNQTDDPSSQFLSSIGEVALPQSSITGLDNAPCGGALDIPQNWAWCRLKQLTELITSGSRGWAKYYAGSGPVFLTMGNLSKVGYKLRLDNLRHVRPPKSTEGNRTLLKEGDVLISITGEVGNLGLLPKDFGEAYINQHTCMVRLRPECRNRYFVEYLGSSFAKRQFNFPQRGIKNSFRLSDVGEMLVPLPPLHEQLRIVHKLDELNALIQRLEGQQQELEKLAEVFAQSCVTSITGITIARTEKMKAPKTELVSMVSLAKKPREKTAAPLAKILGMHKGSLSAKQLWQESGLEIDKFYLHLKAEIANGWIAPPMEAEVKVIEES